MNLNPMPCSATAAELEYDRQCQRAEERHDALREQYPLEDFRDKALLNMFDETGFECLLQLRELASMEMMIHILRDIGRQDLLPCGGEGLKTNADLLSRWFDQWVECEQERLQAEAIEAAR